MVSSKTEQRYSGAGTAVQNRPEYSALLELVKKAVYQVQSEQLSDMIKETVREAMQGVPAAPTDSSSFTEETVGDEKNYFQKDIQFAQFYDFGDD